MMQERELEEFFAHIDEISQDSACTDQYSLIQKLRNENNRLKGLLSSLRSSTKEVLNVVKNERQQKLTALQELERSSMELENLRKSYEELDKSYINNQFAYKENLDDLELKYREEHEDYIELSKDYFELLSEVTSFNNFEIKKDRNKILGKTSNFLQETLGEKYQKPKLVVKRALSVKNSKSAKRTRNDSKKEKAQNAKRKKIDIWEMKSISEANSPMSFHEELIEEQVEIQSECSFKTFSIGNETAFSSIASKKVNLLKNIQCKCRVVTREPDLVSVGVNTEECEEFPKSMPSFDDDSIDFNQQNDLITSTVSSSDIQTQSDLRADSPVVPEVVENQSVPELDNVPEPVKSPLKRRSIGISTENSQQSKETKDQSTSVSVETSSKSTSTVHSVTHRGTMTPARSTKNIGVQFPDITLEKIFEEMTFDLPKCLSPIRDDEIAEVLEVEKSTKATQTDGDKKLVSSEEQSFIVLGQTVFNLFMERLRETNKTLNDDANTRQRLREQLLDRFDELTFDEYFSPSFVSVEAQEKVLRKVFEDVSSTKCHETQRKDNFEAKAASLGLDLSSSESSESIPEITTVPEVPMDTSEVDVNLNETNVVSCKEPENEVIREEISLAEIEVSPVSSLESIKSFAELEVSSESSQEDINRALKVTESEENLTSSESSTSLSEGYKNALAETDELFKALFSSPRKLISPIKDLSDLAWSSLFPESLIDPLENDIDSIGVDESVLNDYDIEHEPLNIPLLGENGTDSPYAPPDLAFVSDSPYEPVEIPLECDLVCQRNLGKVLQYDENMRLKLVTWQNNNMKQKKVDDKRLCKIRKSISEYLNAEWTDENLEKCISEISTKNQQLLIEAIFETVEDNKCQREINLEFTPPAPPLPRYQQKLILLISKLSAHSTDLPHKIVSDLEMRLFKCENSSADIEYLRNIAYYYSSLVDLFFEGDPTVVFYFIIKCIYFYGYKAIPMVFVLIKAFPLALPKKSILLKKYSKNVDWEKMTGLEISKVRLDLEWMDSLDLCVMYLLTNIQMYRRKGQEFKVIYEHELFNYLPKMYGFQLSFIAAPKLLDVLMKRLEDGDLKNLSMSLILLGKRMNKDFTVRMLLKGKLLPLLKKYVEESLKSEEQPKLIEKICLLIESISTILKPLTDEKDKSFKEIFPLIVNILGRSGNQMVQEYCIKAILRMQRFIENHKEIYEMIKHHYEKRNSFTASLQHAIVTFMHRKKEAYFKE